MPSQNPIVKWPFGAATLLALVATGANAIEIVNSLTIVDGVAVAATGNRTINLTIDAGVEAGARLLVKTKSTGTETLIPGTGMKGETITGVAGKTQVVEYVFDGTSFVQIGKFIQID